MVGRSRTAPVQAIAGNSTQHAVPDVVNLKVDDAVATLQASGFEPDIQGDGAIVVEQSPAPGAVLGRTGRVAVKTRDGVTRVSGGVAFVPDIRGLTIRRAINSLAAQRLDAVVIGTGTVVGQSPAPGERLRQGASVTLRCEPRSTTTTQS
jgi:penicillin-binding protein 2B